MQTKPPSKSTLTTASAPTSFERLEALLQARFPELTPGQQRIATRVLGDPEGCAFMTVSELAAEAGVNESTVVRFATALGLNGYPALARLCRGRLRSQAQMLSRFRSVEYLAGAPGDLLMRAVSFDQANIARTVSRIEPERWSVTVKTLAAVPRVHVLGLRKCFTVAYLLGYLLSLVREEVHQLGIHPAGLVDEVRAVQAGDAFIAISIHRYTRDTLRALRSARERGARTIVFTDNAASPLASLAEHCYYVDTAGVSLLRSVTAFICLVQALATDVAAERGTQTRAALRLEEELLAEFDVYEASALQGSDADPAAGQDGHSRRGSPVKEG